jgi:DNA-directed RNA polymerase specialized sigma subunit
MEPNKNLDTWKQWKKSKDPELLGNLLQSYGGMIQQSVNRYDNQNIPRSALEAHAKNQAFIAFSTYNPKHGAQLSTHLGHRLKKLYSYVARFANTGKISEGNIGSINVYKLAKEDLRKKLSREPSIHELADELSWDVNRVSRMETSLRGDYITSGVLQDLPTLESHPMYEKMRYVYFDLLPEEQNVWDFTMGDHGRPRLTPGRIAETMGISNSKVSTIKAKISSKMSEFDT